MYFISNLYYFMANKGKPWLPKHDLYLADNIDQSNVIIAEVLERSPFAVECRRSTLSVALIKSNTELTVDECIARFRADSERVNCFLKRHEREESERKTKKSRSSGKPLSFDSAEYALVSEASACIFAHGGSTSEVWADPSFVPVMIKYYNGLNAYSSAVRDQISP